MPIITIQIRDRVFEFFGPSYKDFSCVHSHCRSNGKGCGRLCNVPLLFCMPSMSNKYQKWDFEFLKLSITFRYEIIRRYIASPEFSRVHETESKSQRLMVVLRKQHMVLLRMKGRVVFDHR